VTPWAFAVAALAASFLLTLVIKRAARGLGLIDVPNERSSHALPTPRGGGVAIAISSLAAMGLLAALGIMPAHLLLAIAPGGVAVAAVGLIDDIRPLSARVRLFVHFMAATWAVVCIGPVGFFQHFAPHTPEFRWLGDAISTVAIVWFLNMYNFMDGIDGIAASQAVFMCAGVALLALFSAGIAYTAAAAIVVGAASCGFLLWNWPPAKIFMGDVGSGYLGFVFAVLGLASGAHSVFGPWSCLILAGVFAIDATFTVVWRFLSGKQVTEAHRTHAFQLLARRMGHRKVTLTVGLVNMVWLFPCALGSVLWPQDAMWITAVALTPLVICAFAIGAGRPEGVPVTQEPSAVIIQFRPLRLSAAVKRGISVVSPRYHDVPRRQYSSSDSGDFSDRSANDIG
jgi:Fuc2NAc and GlcNAc transferase